MVNLEEATKKAHMTSILIGNSLGWIANTIFEFFIATIAFIIMYLPLALVLIKLLHYTPEIVGMTFAGVLITNYTYSLHNKDRLKEILSQLDKKTFALIYLSYNIIIAIYTTITNYLYTFSTATLLLALFWFPIDAWLIEHQLDKISITGLVLTILSKITHVKLTDYSLFGGAGFTGFFGKLQNVFQ